MSTASPSCSPGRPFEISAPAARALASALATAKVPAALNDLPVADLDLLSRWAIRVGSLTSQLPPHHQSNPAAAGYLDLSTLTTVPSVSAPQIHRWVHAGDLGTATELARDMDLNPTDFSIPHLLPASDKFLLAKFADGVGVTLKDLFQTSRIINPSVRDAVRAGFVYIGETRPIRGSVGRESLWVHADDIPDAIQTAKALHGDATVHDKLRLEAHRFGEERKAIALDTLINTCLPAGVTDAQRALVRSTLSPLSAEYLEPSARLNGAWKQELVLSAYLDPISREPAIAAAMAEAYRDPDAGRPPVPDRVIQAYTRRAIDELVLTAIPPVPVTTMREAMDRLGSIFIGIDRHLPSCPFAKVGAQLLGDDLPYSSYASLWPILLPLAPDIPAGPLRDQVLACAQSVTGLHGVLQEIEAQVQADLPGSPPPPAETVREALDLITTTRPDPSITDLAGAIAWCHGRNLQMGTTS